MNKLAIMIAILALAALPAWAEAGWATLNSAEHGFSLDYPDDWDAQINEGALLALSKLEADLPLVIAVAAEADSTSAEEGIMPAYLEAEMASLEQEISALGFGDAVTLERGYSQVNNLPAYVLDLKLDFMGMAEMRMYNVIVDLGPSLVLLSFSGENGAYNNNADIFARMRNSLRPLSDGLEPAPAPEGQEEY